MIIGIILKDLFQSVGITNLLTTWLVYPVTDTVGSHIQHPAHVNLTLSYDLLSL